MTTFFNLGHDENLNNFAWKDNVRPAEEGRIRVPLEKENFRPEDTEESEIFIRELAVSYTHLTLPTKQPV